MFSKKEVVSKNQINKHFMKSKHNLITIISF
jgi:hypothetical protein